MFIVVVIIPAKLIAGHPQQPSFAMIQTIFASDTERTIEGSVGDDKELRLDLGNSINGLYSSDGIELTLSADGFQSIHLPLLPRRPKDWGGTFKDPDTNAELLLKTPFKLASQISRLKSPASSVDGFRFPITYVGKIEASSQSCLESEG